MKNILYVLGGLFLLILVGLSVSWYKDNQLVKETSLRVAAETKLIELGKEEMALDKQSDSIPLVIAQKDAEIESLKRSQIIIIQQNEKTHLDIDRLNAYNSYLRFTNNAANYENNRERYNLQRFRKDN